MDDKEFNALRLRASLCPGAETDWAPAETTHWIALHACKDELRSKVSKTLAALEAVNADKSLSFEGKKAAKAKLAAQSLDELEQAESLTKAEAAVRAQLDRWAQKIAAHVKPAEDHSQAVLAAQIRQRVSDMRENRLEFLRKHAAADPSIASALLEAPAFLSNLNETELTLLRNEVEKKFLGEEVVEAKSATERAYSDCVAAQRAAKAMIVAAAGLNGAAKAPAKVT